MEPGDIVSFAPLQSLGMVSTQSAGRVLKCGATAINTFWYFPLVFVSGGNSWDVQSFRYGPQYPQEFIPLGNPQFSPPYNDGTWTAITVAGGAFIGTADKMVPISGNDYAFTSVLSTYQGINFLRAQWIFTLDPAFWTFIKIQDLYSGYVPFPIFGIAPFQQYIPIAKWDANPYSIRLASSIKAGKYKGACGLLSAGQGYSFVPPNQQFPEQILAVNNTIGGTIKFEIAVPNLSIRKDVTPPGANISNQNPNPEGSDNDGAGATAFSINSTALLGAVPFVPIVTVSAVPDPGLASCNYQGEVVYGGYFSTTGF